jgi:uncharacterized protein YbjT (DUF2867 family)
LRILLTGATGLIGSAVLARLRCEGHEVTGVARPAGARVLPPAARWVSLDINLAIEPAAWLPHLAGVEAVINCAGVLQDTPSDSTMGVHVAGASALFTACEQAGVRRIIHISALGIDRDAPTAFSRTKRAGDAALMAHDLDWVVLRPSVVLGRPAFGGSALFRGLAALPIIPQAHDTGPLQVVQLDDLVQTIAYFLRPHAPTRMTLDIAGPEALAFTDIVLTYRRWLGWKDAPVVRVPRWMSHAATRLGDFAGWLGWRPPIRSTARIEIARGSGGDPAEWTRVTGVVPRTLAAALACEPASVQERWFARLYLLKPLLIGAFSLFWFATGVLSLGPGWERGVDVVREAGVAAAVAPLLVLAGAVADIGIGIGIALRRTARLALRAGFALSACYLMVGSALAPQLWSDPLGPLLKILPILMLNLALLAILDDR